MTTEAYVRDPRFEAHGAAIKWDGQSRAVWYDHGQLVAQLAKVDWSRTAVLCHHAHFDGLILSHHFGVYPALWICSLSMARLLVGNHLSLSLDSLAKHFDLGSKSMPYNLLSGWHWHQMDAWRKSAVADGAVQDCELTWLAFGMLSADFPAEEYDVVDMTVRMFTEPTLLGDQELLGRIWYEENDRKHAIRESLGVDRKDLSSNLRFAQLLEQRGIEVEYKEGKNGEIPAVAKNDPFMQGLLDHEDEEIVALVEARIDSKSTTIQTRAAAIGNMAMRGPLCVYLFAYGAHTTRWAGGDGTNFQNLKRRHDIRKSLCAPGGYLLAVPDQSQIECRLLNFLAGQHDVIERFRQGHDPYVGIASQFYGRDITKADESERGTGKQAELSCGYGCGGAKFQRTARLGIYGPPVLLDPEESTRFVHLYRHTHPAVVRYWRQADHILAALAGGHEGSWGPLSYEGGRIYLPNGAPLIYETLEWHCDEKTFETGWRRKTRKGWDKMYGAKMVEQTTQALARVTASQAMARIRKAGFRIVGTSHDEAWILIKDDPTAAEAAEFCRQEMMRVPEWLPGIPLDAEIKVGQRYSK